MPGPVDTIGRLGRGLAGLALTSLPGRPRRLVWSCPGRIYIEAHGVHGPGGERVARRIERALEGRRGVLWARVNAPSSRVIVGVGKPAPRQSELIDVIARAEAEPATPEEHAAEDELHHPADGAVHTRLLPTIMIDAFGLVLATINKIAPWAPLPSEVAALTALIDLHPRLRELAAGRMGGSERADSATSMAAAVLHGLAARGEGTALDIVQRATQWREARAQEQAWCRREAELITGPEHAAAEPVVVERPRPLPENPADRYARRALTLG
ncbi:MAG TPA: heavy metal-associated domain-containing protein, partial [Actinophytocola sp.]